MTGGVTVVGAVVGDSLAGLTVIVARDDAPDDDISVAIRARGGAVVPLPLIRIVAPEEPSGLRAVAAAIAANAVDVVAFTSRHAVAAVVGRATAPGPQTVIAAVGPTTARALEAAGWRVDVVGDAGGAALAQRLAATLQEQVRGARVCVPQADAAHPALVEALREAGAIVDVVVAYRSVVSASAADVAAAFAAQRPCALVLTSPQRVATLMALGGVPADIPVVAIGATTAAACEAAGLVVSAQATSPAPDPVCAALAVLHTPS